MSVEETKEAVRRLARAGWTEHDLRAFDDFFAEKAVWHGVAVGLEQIKDAASFWFERVPDFTFTVEDLTAEEDRVAFRWHAEGTHEGELFGVQRTGKHITFSGVAIKHFENGKCVYYREVWDKAGLMEQLGAEVGASL
jgi:predicted ester cyclase